ncbi:MAG: metallophosphoesterase [Candidatus Zixiibacteriota bacterium]
MRTVSAACILVFVAVSTALCQTPCDEISKHPIRFAILGDRTGDHQEGVYEAVVAEVEQMRPDFVMTVGDMIEGYISDTVEMNKQWDEYLGIVKQLTMPIYFTPGNHDITSDAMEPTYRARVAAPYYSFDHRGIHFVILDNSRTENPSEIDEAQITWLREDLAKSSAACYTFVFFHKPFWYKTLGDGQPDALHDIFNVNGVDAVFTGHFHKYFSAEFDGVVYTSIGSSGGQTEESPDGLLYHFGWVTVDGDGVHIGPIKKDAVLPWDVQTVAGMRAANTVKESGITFAQPVRLSNELALVDGTATVVLNNPVIDAAWSDTLRWETPQGWTITPSIYPFTMETGGSVTAQFTIKAADTLYPLPTVSTRLPYGEGRSTRVSQDLEVARTAYCTQANGPVVVDGQLTEACWSRPVTALFGNDALPSKVDSTAFYFAYDDVSLYVGVYCREASMDQLRASMTERDAAVYTEDAVGVMIQPRAASADVAQFYVNPLGTVYDQLIERASDGYWSGRNQWNGEIEVNATRATDSWVVEMRIPLGQFDALGSSTPQSGDRWRVQFRRKQARTNSAAAFQSPWQYDPTGFGELVME